MADITPQTIKDLQTEILTWYASHQRDLPWRKTREPYSILISEIMSQQTQIMRVVPKYLAWLERFPTIQSLAKAETGDVLKYWSGLGYNRRAINLQKCAKVIVEEFAGVFPREIETLKKLPGIGDYTASAIACFAFDQQVVVVDTNVRKVILIKLLRYSRELSDFRTSQDEFSKKRNAGLGPSTSAGRQHDDRNLSAREIKEIAEQLLPRDKAYIWNQALMDYAAAMLKHEKIPVPKQSTFKGSNRYYRGQIIKLLLEYKTVSIKYLVGELGNNEVFIEKIIQELEKDGLVKQIKNKIALP